MSFYVRANTTGKIYITDAETYSLPTYTEFSTGWDINFKKTNRYSGMGEQPA